MQITMRATYGEMWWESDEPDTEPERDSGFTDPKNPWGGLDAVVPEELHGEELVAWQKENVDVVTFETLREAAQFVIDFPGGVWDLREGEWATVNYQKGLEREVTLHVGDGHKECVFEMVDVLERVRSIDPTIDLLVD